MSTVPIVTTSTDYLYELVRLVEREHQRLNTLESELQQLRDELAGEKQRRQVLSGRVDQNEMRWAR